jgi:type I restriction enzyme S subunit
MKPTPLSQLATVSAGQAAPKDDEFSDHGTPFVRAGSLDRLLSGKAESDLELVSDETAKLRKLKTYPKGTILFAKSGMSATKDRIYVLQNPAYVVSHLATLIPNVNAHTDYLRLVLKRFPPSVLIKDLAYPAISLSDIQSYQIPVPEQRDDQIRIAHLLGKVEGLIAQRKQHLQQLNDLLKSVFLEIFGDPAFNTHHWDYGTFEDAIEYIGDIGTNGSNAVVAKNLQMSDKEDYALMVRTVNLNANDFTDNVKYVSRDTYDFFKKSKVFGGELIMNKIGSAGLFWIMPNLDRPVSLGLNQLLIRIKKEISIEFIYHFYSTRFGKIKIANSIRGAATKSITKTAVKELPLLLPPKEIQNKFAAIVKKVECIKSRYQRSLSDLESLYGELSQHAFKGELDLSRIPFIRPLLVAEATISFNSQASAAPTAFPMPESELSQAALKDRTQLEPLLHHWLELYRLRTDNVLFSPEHFLTVAQSRLEELHPENDYPLGLEAYEYVKKWVFEALNAGKLEQTLNVTELDDFDNPIYGNKLILKSTA